MGVECVGVSGVARMLSARRAARTAHNTAQRTAHTAQHTAQHAQHTQHTPRAHKPVGAREVDVLKDAGVERDGAGVGALVAHELAVGRDDNHLARLHVAHALERDGPKRAVLGRDRPLVAVGPRALAEHERALREGFLFFFMAVSWRRSVGGGGGGCWLLSIAERARVGGREGEPGLSLRRPLLRPLSPDPHPPTHTHAHTNTPLTHRMPCGSRNATSPTPLTKQMHE